jgi:hypothetical protein
VSKDERIDLAELEEQFNDGLNWDEMNTMELIVELNKMYKREDALFNAIKELRDSEDSTGCSEDLTVVHLSAMQTLYELFPNTAYWGCACQGPHTGPC